METLRLCFVGPCDSVTFRRWVEWFAARGHTVTALTVEPADPAPASFRQVNLASSVPWRKVGRLISAVRLRRAVARLRPDLVHVHYARGLAWGLVPTPFHPLVITPWGSDVLEEQGAFREWYSRALTRRLLASADLVTVHSAYLEGRVRALVPAGAPVARIGWGVDLARFRPGLDTRDLRVRWGIRLSDRVILSPRLVQPFYRHDLVIRALARAIEKIPQSLLVILEDRPDRQYVTELHRLAKEEGVEGRVKFVPAVPYADMPRWYNLAEVVVMVPRSDGMPNTLLEAMACGAVPVLGRLPQYDEVVRHGENGWLADPDPDGLAEALIEALGSARTSIAERNRALVAAVADQDKEMARMERHYRELAQPMGHETDRVPVVGIRGAIPAPAAGASRRLKVLLVTVGLDVGGTEMQIRELALRLDRARFDVAVCGLKGPGVIGEELRARGARVVTLNGAGKGDVRVLVRLARLVAAERPDIVHAFLGFANVAASLVGRLLGVPVVIWSYRDLEVWKTRPRWLLDRAALRWADAVTCCSDAVRRFVLAHVNGQAAKFSMIHNGVDVELFRSARPVSRSELGVRDGVAVIGTVARLDEPKKGLTVLLRALAGIAARSDVPDWQVLLVGDGPARAELERTAAELGLAGQVVFAGVRRDIPSVLRVLDVFVCPSLYEGFGIVIVEAMAAGRPVVASAVGGVPEIVVDGETGLLVPAGDAPALADAIARLLRDPASARQMGARGGDRARELFSVERMVRQHERLYEALSARLLRSGGRHS